MEKHFNVFTIKHIPRSLNNEADNVAKAAARKQSLLPDVFYEEITTPSMKQKKEKTNQFHLQRRLDIPHNGLPSRSLRANR